MRSFIPIVGRWNLARILFPTAAFWFLTSPAAAIDLAPDVSINSTSQSSLDTGVDPYMSVRSPKNRHRTTTIP